jgi:hypothetical protein
MSEVRRPFVQCFLPSLCRVLIAAASGASAVHAQEFKVSGFASLVAGRSSGSCQPHALASRYDDSCKCTVVDWAHGGVITSDWELDVETRAGLQLDWKLDRQWSATA